MATLLLGVLASERAGYTTPRPSAHVTIRLLAPASQRDACYLAGLMQTMGWSSLVDHRRSRRPSAEMFEERAYSQLDEDMGLVFGMKPRSTAFHKTRLAEFRDL